MKPKRKFLMAYDYGQGAVWLFMMAAAPDEIRRKYPEMTLVETPPQWLDEEEQAALRVVDIDDRADPFLCALVAERSA